MKLNLKYLTFCLSFLFLNSSCLKFDNSPQVSKTKPSSCEDFSNLKMRMVDTFECGKDIYISIDSIEGVRYYWEGPTLINVPDYLNRIKVTDDANLFHRGWYYVTTSFKNCPSKLDSIYVNVKLNQGKPTCSPPNNTSTYSGSGINIPNKNFTNVSSNKFSSSFEIYAGGSTGGDFKLVFSEYWTKNKLETGIYYTTKDNSLYEITDINKVYIEDRNYNNRWQAEEKQPVFISYVNGMLTVTICDLYIYDPSNSSFLNSRLNTRITVQ